MTLLSIKCICGLSNWDLRKDLWTQDSPFQFSAESVAWHEQLLLEPQHQGNLLHSIQFDKFTFLFEQGQFTAAASCLKTVCTSMN
ncbi:hypothetical protein LMH73_002295 [Vibrio splendidus]